MVTITVAIKLQFLATMLYPSPSITLFMHRKFTLDLLVVVANSIFSFRRVNLMVSMLVARVPKLATSVIFSGVASGWLFTTSYKSNK